MNHSAGPLRPIFVSVGQQEAMASRTLRHHRRRIRTVFTCISVAIVLATALIFAIRAL